ncbi:MAG TPA: hypothetical protein VGC67_12790 [Cellulomonas sp.]
MSYQAVLDALRADNLAAQTEAPVEVVKMFHLRMFEKGTGYHGLPFMAWFFIANDARYVAAYSYQIVRLVQSGDFTLAQAKTMFENFVPQPAGFIGDCGLHRCWEHVQAVLSVYDEIGTLDQMEEVVNEVLVYGSHLNAWIHHYYPWNLGYAYQPMTRDFALAAAAAYEGEVA